MVGTSEFTGARPKDPEKLAKHEERIAQRNDKLSEQLIARDAAAGIDIAGPERKRFSADGLEDIMAIYDLASAAAKVRGQPVVLRPHVGEGYAKDGGDHAAVAHKNLELLIDALKSKKVNSERDGVILRFGHAAHATPDQIKAMKELGIIVEANLSSNVTTGSQTLEKHPILQMLYQELDVVLATDGGGVMNTKLDTEYKLAKERIDEFKNEPSVTIEVDGKPRTYASLSRQEKARFDLQRLQESAARYHDKLKQREGAK
jgi:hypothetical protein